MRKALFLQDPDLVAFPHRDGGSGPFPHAIDRQDRGLVEGAREKGTGGMGLVVLGENQRPSVFPAQSLAEHTAEMELLAQPHRDGLPETAKSARRKREVGFQQSLELEIGFLVEGHVVEIAGADFRLRQAVFDRLGGKIRVVLLAGEALLLSGCHDLAVAHQRGRRVVVEGGYPQDVHGQRINLRIEVSLVNARTDCPGSVASREGKGRRSGELDFHGGTVSPIG